MKELIQYQIEVAICMAAFTLLYLLLWKKETNFTFKRILLLGIPLSSIVIPLINLNINLQPAQETAPIQYFTYLPNQLELVYAPVAAEAEKMTGWEMAFWVFVVGSSVMLIRLIVSYYKIWQLYRQSAQAFGGDFRIIEDPMQSFSFFNLVMINKSQAQSSEREYIISHEKAHSRQGHSFDVLWLELVKMLHWFNPMIWLITRESKQNMEYLADQEVTLKTQSVENYQYAIVQHATGSGYQLLKTQFSKSNLKNRIVMMNRPNNRKVSSWKLLAILPVLTILLMSFSLKIENLIIKDELAEVLPPLNFSIKEPAFPDTELNKSIMLKEKKFGTIESINTPEDTVDHGNNEVFTIVEEQPYPSNGDMDSYIETINANLKYPENAKKEGIKGKVFVQFIVQKDGSLADVKVVKGIGHGCDEEAVRVIKDGPPWISGKQRGKNVNVRFIIPVTFGDQKNKISGTIYNQDGSPVSGANVIIKGTTIGTVTDYDGKFLLTVEPEQAEIVISLTGFKAQTEKIIKDKDYEINLESDPNAPSPPARTDTDKGISIRANGKYTIDPIKQPLFIIDGVEMENFDLKSIDPADIESISVLKDAFSKNQYGEKGKNGVIIIRLKGQPETENANNQKLLLPEHTDVETTGYENSDQVKIATSGVFSIDTENPPVVYIDGTEIPIKELEKIDADEINSISVIKGENASEQYGDKGKNGVILVKMKNSARSVDSSSEELISPTYQGGVDAFYRSIQRSVKYPREARENGIQGKVFVKFTVSSTGQIINIESGDSTENMMKEIVVVGYGNNSNDKNANKKDLTILEKEIERVLKQVEDFTPGTKDGEPVDVRMTLPVTFKITDF